MSATNRGAERRADDFYETPGWCVWRLLETLPLPLRGMWLEPCAGNLAIVGAVNGFEGYGPTWTTNDIRLESSANFHFNFLDYDLAQARWDVVITNPPFSLAAEFIRHALPLAPWVVMLLRLNFLGSAKRSAFFRKEMPDVYVLPNRPSFTEDGRTDATEYAWMVWTPERGRTRGALEVLAETPAEERGR